MRIAETRAVNRAVRKAYGTGLCSVEELGSLAGSPAFIKEQTQRAESPHSSGSKNGQPRLRDRLCVLIRQYSLDPMLKGPLCWNRSGVVTCFATSGTRSAVSVRCAVAQYFSSVLRIV